MKLFSEKVQPTLTNSTHNILQVEDYNEIFFGVYEIEINKTKYPVEKISEHNGNPVVSVPVTVKGVKSYYPFVLSKGKFEVLFNENNTDDKLNDEPLLLDDQVISEKTEYPQEVEEEETYYNLVEKNKEILEQIEKAKGEAIRMASEIKKQKLKEEKESTYLQQRTLKKMMAHERVDLVNEFLSISNKIKAELIDENDNRFDEIKQTIDNKINDLSDSLHESVKNDFDSSSTELESKIKELVLEIHKSLEPKIDNELKNIALEIVEKVDSIEQNLDNKLSDKADKTLIENVEGELSSVAKANVELNDKINKGVNKALSRVGNIDKKVDELTIALSEEVENKISNAEENIAKYYTEKLKVLEEKTFDITEETRKYIINLVTESRDNLIAEIRQIKNEKPIEYIVESKGKKQSINSDDLVKDFDKKINSKIDNEVTRLRKYIAVYSGGGSVAQQFADGGTMNGNLIVNGGLTITGAISASEYLGIDVTAPYFVLGFGDSLRDPIETLGIQYNDETFVILRTTDDFNGVPFYSTNGSQYTSLADPGQKVYYNGIQWVMEIYGDGGEYVTTYFALTGSQPTPDDMSIWTDYPFIQDVWVGPTPLFSRGTLFFINNDPVEIYIWNGVGFTFVGSENTFDINDYLPLSGGDITGTTTINGGGYLAWLGDNTNISTAGNASATFYDGTFTAQFSNGFTAGTFSDSNSNTVTLCNDTDALTVNGDASFTNDVEVLGNLAVDSNTLFVDSATGRVGIGTATPTVKLDVSGEIKSFVTGASTSFTAYNPANGFPRGQFLITYGSTPTNVGFSIAPGDSTASNSYPTTLEVNMNKDTFAATNKVISLYQTSTYASIHALGPAGNSAGTPLKFSTRTYRGDNSGLVINNDTNQTISIGTDTLTTTAQLNVVARDALHAATFTGNVGIGTTTPNEKLTVVGNISATGSITATSATIPTINGDTSFADDVEVLGELTATGQPVLSALTDNHVLTYPLLNNLVGDFPTGEGFLKKEVSASRYQNIYWASLATADVTLGTTFSFPYQAIATSAGKYTVTFIDSFGSPAYYFRWDVTHYAYGNYYSGARWNVNILRAPDNLSVWSSITKSGTPTVSVDEVITGSRGSQITVNSTTLTTAVIFKSIGTRLPSNGEVFTVTGGSFTIGASSSYGNTVSDAEAAYTGLLMGGAASADHLLFLPTTFRAGTIYIHGYYNSNS